MQNVDAITNALIEFLAANIKTRLEIEFELELLAQIEFPKSVGGTRTQEEILTDKLGKLIQTFRVFLKESQKNEDDLREKLMELVS